MKRFLILSSFVFNICVTKADVPPDDYTPHRELNATDSLAVDELELMNDKNLENEKSVNKNIEGKSSNTEFSRSWKFYFIVFIFPLILIFMALMVYRSKKNSQKNN